MNPTTSLASRVVDAAEERLALGDVSSISLRALARDVGVTAPALYTHFRSKDDILAAVLARQFAHLDDALDAARIDPSADPVTRLDTLCSAYCRFGLDEPARYAALFGPEAEHFGVAYAGSPGESAFERFADAVGAASGDADQATTHDRAATLWAALHGVIALRTSLSGFPWPPLGEQITSLRAGLLSR